MSDWKPILDAIVGARHSGGVEGLADRLRDLDARYPHTPEIAAELAFTLASSGDLKGALAAYERALVLGLASPAEQANTLVGHATCLLRLDRPADAAAALERARASANGQDVRIGGGASTIRQYLQARLIDELHLAISPVLLGAGERLFEGLHLPDLGYTCTQHVGSGRATHIVLTRE
jgi:riboflavin biosynthesis pyrimidine reductase